jgi:hypothetical protein
MKIGIVASSSYFHEYRERLLGAFHGREMEAIALEAIPLGPTDLDIVLVIGIHEHMRLPISRDFLLAGIQTEQLPCQPTDEFRINRNLKRFHAIRGAYDHLFEWSPGIYASGVHGPEVTWLPHGCQPATTPVSDPRHDLFFVGNLPGTRDRRKKTLDLLGSRYRLYPTVYVTGAAKDEAIQSSAICLNIHYYESGGFESPRMFDYLSRGAFVLGEKSDDSFPFTPGEDFVEYEGEEDLLDKVDYFLSHPEARDKIREAGYRKASEYSFDAVFRRLSLELHRLQAIPTRQTKCLSRRLCSRVLVTRFHSADRLSALKGRILSREKRTRLPQTSP